MIFRAAKRAISDRPYTGGNMSIDMKDLPAAVQRQILKQMRDADARKAEKGARERTATVASALAVTGEKENKLHAKRTEDGYASIREADRAAELKSCRKPDKSTICGSRCHTCFSRRSTRRKTAITSAYGPGT